VLSKPFPVTRTSLHRKIIRDLTGQTFFKQRIQPTINRLRNAMKGVSRKPARVADRPVLRFWIINLIAIGALTALGYWWAWVALWVVPLATWFPLVTRLRNIAEHAMVETTDDPFTHARTTLANPLERLLIAPFWVHFHAEHHLFMYLPCYNLAAAHELLMQKGFRDRMRIAKSYGEVLAKAAPKQMTVPA
jgi:fatty acid desaturase